jgi:protease-4
MEITLLGGLLDRAGVRAQLRALGKYKSMRETFTERRASDANREMMQSLVDDLGQQVAETVAACRGGDGPSVAAAIDQGPFRADEALDAGLVDKLEYFDELWSELGGETGKVQSAAHFARQQRARRILPAPRPAQVALVRVSGNIRSGHDRFGRHGKRATGSLSLARTVRRARRSKSIKAIVLRIDSPGGSALASDLMWRELTLAAKDKPLFVSMVNVAASGGYYASGVKGATVWTNPTTLTGSIGVVAGKFEISGLLDKLDISRQAVGSGPRASYHSISSAWGAPELEKLDRDLDAHYRAFVTKMADARGMTYDALHALAQGRVWTGKQAHERGLVDHLGGLHEVIACLRETLKLPEQRLLRWSILAPAAGLKALLSPDSDHDDEGLRAVSALLPRVDELAGGWLEIAADLGSERLLALSPLGGWRNRR